jgi:type IV pilus assembly protein PilC
VQTKNPNFKQKIIKISQLVEEGNSLSEAFAKYPDIFNIFYTSLIKTGEASGRISESLYYLSDHLEREHDIESQIKSAMIYPAFVICVLAGVVLIIMFFVMPRLIDLLKQTATKPPFFTALMMNFYAFMMNFGWIVIVGFMALAVFIVYYFTTKEGKKKYDAWLLKTPLIGSFFKKIYLITFAENISTLISAGLSINNALKITKDAINNFVYKKIIAEVGDGVSEGQKISAILVKYQDFIPPFVVQMIEVGEETGKLDKNLVEIVNFYQKEVNRAVATFTALLEPILIIVLGGIVALLAVSVIEPLYGALGTI